MDRYVVTVNDETVVDTDRFVNAAAAYSACVDAGHKGDVIDIAQYDWSGEKLKTKVIRRCIV